MDTEIKEGTLRLLTLREIELARQLFAGRIIYPEVWVHCDRYLPAGLQRKYTAMAPNGEIDFRKELYRSDFSATEVGLNLRHIFIHKMAYVWQHQKKMWVRTGGFFRWAANLFLLVFILAGCESADPRPKIFPAKVFTLNDHVCVLVPAAEGEFLLSVEINGTGSEERLRKVFIHNKPVYLSSQRCVPLFGYQFESGRAYGVSVQAVTQENQQNNIAGRIYTVSFSLWKDQSNKLQVAIQ